MRHLPRLYPKRWRSRYGDEFADLLAQSEGGARLAADAVRGAVDAHVREGAMGAKRMLPWAILLACDVALGWGNLHTTDDVQPVAAGLLLAGFGFAFHRPRLAWLLVLLLWLSIPVSSVYGDAINLHPGLAKPHPLYETLVALIPTVLGAAAGAGTRWVVRQARDAA